MTETKQYSQVPIKRDACRYISAMLKRPVRALARYLFFREEMNVLLQRFSSRGEAMQEKVDGSQKFGIQLRSTYPRIHEFIEQVACFFDQEQGINYVGFVMSDPQASTPQLYEVVVRKVEGLSPTEAVARLNRGLLALASADVRRLEQAGMPTAIIVQMILATCYQSPPPIEQEIPWDKIFRVANHNAEVIGFFLFYNAWLRSGQTL